MKIGNNHLPPVTPASTKAVKTTGTGEQKAVPPGLEKVQARQQSVPAADRNAGQTTAADRVSRNIARYAETQAIVAPPASPAPPVASTPTPEASTTPTADASTPSSETPTT